MDLYQRQNRDIGITQTPSAPQQQTSNISNTLSFFANESMKMAKRNYELGKTEVLDQIVDSAYKLNPTNKQAFMKQVNKNLNKAVAGLPPDLQIDAVGKVNSLVNSYGKEIEKNIYTQQKREFSTRVNTAYDNSSQHYVTTYGMLVDDIFQAGTFNLDKKLSKEDAEKRMKDYTETAKAHKQLLDRYAYEKETAFNVTDEDGKKVIKKENKFDKTSPIKQRIYNLDLESLKAFDKTTFRDRDRFMKTFGLDDKEYQELDSYIAKSIKDKGDSRDAMEQTAVEYSMAQQSMAFDEEAMRKAQEKYPDVISDKLIKSMKKNSKYVANPTLVQNEDENFLAHLSMLSNLAGSKNDGKPEYDKRLFETLSDTALEINAYRQQFGASEDTQKYANEMMTNLVQNQAFADAINTSIYDKTTSIGQILSDTKERIASGKAKSSERMADYSEIKQLQNAIAKEGARNLSAIALRFNTMEGSTEEGKANIMRDLTAVKDYYNKRIVSARYKDYVSEQDLFKMEKMVKEGKEVRLPINGITYKFKGFSENDIILEA